MNSLKQVFWDIFNSIDFELIRDHPNILIAANFWEPERFSAAKTCYRYMRHIDDLIDNHKAEYRTIPAGEKEMFADNVNLWLDMIKSGDIKSPIHEDLKTTILKFKIPVWPLEAFAKSMLYDIDNDGFPTLESFLGYAQGASVAPASIFVHLTGLTSENGEYKEPSFNVKDAATPCALFSYLVHIIRDFQKDQFNNLNYFPDDIVSNNGLTRKDLRQIAMGGTVPDGFRNIVGIYHSLADDYRKKTLAVIREIGPGMEPRYKLSLEVIFSLYTMVFERIDVEKGGFTALELNPTPEETKQRVRDTINSFDS